MPRFLSPEWLDALAQAAARSTALRDVTTGQRLVIEQTVRATPSGDVTYRLGIEDGAVAVHAGVSTTDPSVSFTTDYRTAVAINRGEESAQAAFLRGQLRVGGDIGELLRHGELLALLDDVFADLRAETEY